MPFGLAGVRRNAVLLAAVLLALIAGLLVYSYLARYGATTPVVVMAHDVPGPQLLAEKDVRVVPLPTAAVHPQAFQSTEEVVGRWLTTPAAAGQPLLATQLQDGPAGGSPLQVVLDENQVGFFLPAPLERLLGGAVSAGDRVDIIFVANDGFYGEIRSEILARGVPVLEVRDLEGQSSPAGEERGEIPAGIVLAVSAEDAQRLAFALDQGVVYVALRSAFAPLNTEWPGGVTWSNLFPRVSELPTTALVDEGDEDKDDLGEHFPDEGGD